jgi:hypothetical protein
MTLQLVSSRLEVNSDHNQKEIAIQMSKSDNVRS